MKKSCSIKELKMLLESIKCSEVAENRIQLLKELEEIDLTEKAAVNSVIESFTIFWEDFTCLDVSQCALNKMILTIATRCLESEISECLVLFLDLGIKANMWCQKHLKMTLMSTGDSTEEEHSGFFYQLVLDLLTYSAACYSGLTRYLVLINKDLIITLENFISEQLTLMKDLVSEIKRIQVLGTDILKGVQASLDAVTRLCRVYCDGIDWDTYHAKNNTGKNDCKEDEHGDNVIIITGCAVQKLCELGIVAANDGGSLVSLLNTSWKGVVSLLQLCKGGLSVKINITGVITTLISLATESLKCAVENWSSSMSLEVSVAESKRIFLPVKFYLINAVRIISQYQMQALSIYREISLCVIRISTFRISLSKLENLNSVSEMLAEILEPTSLHLLNSLLNSAQVQKENKFQILDFLFNAESFTGYANEATWNSDKLDSLNAIFSVSSDSKESIFSLGRVSLFLNLLKGAVDLDDDVRFGIAKKLGWLLDAIVEEDVYSSILVLRLSSLYDSAQKQETVYQPMYCLVLNALKTFMITVSSSPAWNEVEIFLIENLFHPHFLCGEIVTELWCFVMRHADNDMVYDVIDKLCSLLRLMFSESALFPDSAARKTAKLICTLVNYGPKSIVDRVYDSLFDWNTSQPSTLQTVLLIEGFSLDLLSAKNRSAAIENILTQYFEFLEMFEDKAPQRSNFGFHGAPVFALCAATQSLYCSLPETDRRTLKFLVTVIHKYKSSADVPTKDYYRTLLAELLTIISNTKHMYYMGEMEGAILELKNLFISAQSDHQLSLCKPSLASFMAGLGYVELSDSEENSKSLAVWELYHMLLKERHWALVHLGITAFGHFAERTSCNQLWRFVPPDASLSFDVESGSEADEERFMSELKAFLEKERASLTIQFNLDHLFKDGKMLKENFQNSMRVDLESSIAICDVMEIDEQKQVNKKRKFPDGISRGVEMLQSGLKVMVDGFSEWKQNQNEPISEEHEKFMSHFSQLEDVIEHLVSLADSS